MVTLAAEFPNDNPDLHDGVIWVCHDVVGRPTAERRQPPPPPMLEVAPRVEAPPTGVAPVLEAPPIAEVTPVLEVPPIVEAAPEPRESGIFAVAPEAAPALALDLDIDGDTFDEDGEIFVGDLTPFEAIAVEMLPPPPATVPTPPPFEEIAAPPEHEEEAVAVAPVAEVAPVVAEVAPLAAEAEPVVAEVEPVVADVAVAMAEVVSIVAEESPRAPSVIADPWMTFVAVMVDVANAQGAARVASTLGAVLEEDSIAKAWTGILRGTSEDWDAIGGSMLDEWASDLLARHIGATDRASELKRALRERGVAAFGMIEAAAA